jgi:hypothetical protein
VTAEIEAAIDALELQVTGDTEGLDTGVTLQTLVDLSNAVAALQDANTGEGGLEERLTAAEGKLAGITSTVTAEIEAAIDGLETQLLDGVSTDFDTLKELADAITALRTLIGGSELGEDGTDLIDRIAALESSLGNLTAAPKNWSEFSADGNTTNAFTVAEIFGEPGLNGSSTVLNTFVTAFANRIDGYDPATVPLTVTGDLTVAQAVALAQAGLAVNTENVTFSIRDAYTTIQSALTNPQANAAMAGATEVVAFGNSNPNTVDMMAFGPSINLRIESGSGDDTVSTGSGDQTIYAAFGTDTIWLTPTEDDTSSDTVVYQTIYEGETLPITALTFLDDADYYREGSVLKVQVNGNIYEYTTVADETVATALQGFATAIENSAAVSGVIIKGNVLEIFGATPSTKLSVVTDAGDPDTIVDISNPGQKTRWKVEFSDDAADYPDNESVGGTIEFNRKVYVTIAGEEVSAEIVYTSPDVADPVATVAALKAAIEAKMASEQPLENVLGSVTIESNGTADVKLVLEGKTVPTTDVPAPTFSVTSAAIDVAGEQHQTEVAFSSVDADYYAGGTLTISVAGEPITTDMVANDAARSVENLLNAVIRAKDGYSLPSGPAVLTLPGTLNSTPFGSGEISTIDLGGSGKSLTVNITDSGVSVLSKTISNENFLLDANETSNELRARFIEFVNGELDGFATFSILDNNLVLTTNSELIGGDVEISFSGNIRTWAPSGVYQSDFTNTTPTTPLTAIGVDVDFPPNSTVAELLETVSQTDGAINESASVVRVEDTVGSLQQKSYALEIDGPFYLLTQSIQWAPTGAEPLFLIDTSLALLDGFYDVSGTPTFTAAMNPKYVYFESVDAFIASLKADGAPDGQSITEIFDVAYSAQTGVLTVTQKEGGPAFGVSASRMQVGEAEPGTGLILTAATEEPDPLSATGTQTYEGEYQQATLSLEDAATYDVRADGSDVSADREVGVYYDGGKAYLTITGAGEDGIFGNGDDVTVTVSADMQTSVFGVETFASNLTISHVFGVKTDPNSIIIGDNNYFSIRLRGDEGTLEEFRTDAGETVVTYLERVQQSSRVGSATFDSETGMVRIELSPSGVLDVNSISIGAQDQTAEVGTVSFIGGSINFVSEISSPGEATSAALVDAINAEIAEQVSVGTASVGQVSDSLTVDTVVANGEGSANLDHFALEFYIDNGTSRTDFTAVARQTNHSDVHYYLNGDSLSYFGVYAYQYGDVTLSSFLARFNELEPVEQAGLSLSLVDGQIVVQSVATGSNIEVGVKVVADFFDVVTTDANPETQDGLFVGSGSGGSLSGIVGSVSESGGLLTLTAATPGKQTFEVSDVRLDYQGVQQIATFSLETAASYDDYTYDLTDGNSLSVTPDRTADVYFSGGQAHVTITETDMTLAGQNDVLDSVTVSVDMGEDDLATSQALVDAINAKINGIEGIEGVSTPAVVTLDTNLAANATLDYFSSGTIAFGFKTSADESEFNWHKFFVGSIPFYNVFHEQTYANITEADYRQKVTYETFVNYLNTIDGTGLDDRFSAEIDETGDIVFTSTATGTDAYLEVALRYVYDGDADIALALDFGDWNDGNGEGFEIFAATNNQAALI